MSAVRKMMDEKADMNMTPMIDVVFLLLIFFMVVTDLTQQDLADLTLPLAISSQEDKGDDKDDRYVVNVTKNGEIKYKGKPFTLEQLTGILNRLKRVYGKYTDFGTPSNPVKASELFILLRADKDTPWQHVQWIMTIMAEEKLYKLQFGVKQYADADYTEDPGEVKLLDGQWKEK